MAETLVFWGQKMVKGQLSFGYTGPMIGMPTKPTHDSGLEINGLRLDPVTREVRYREREITLSKLSFDLLHVLLRAAPSALSVDEILQQAWPNRVVSRQSVKQRVKLLRDQLSEQGCDPGFVSSVRGFGYRVSDVSTGATPIRRWLSVTLACAFLLGGIGVFVLTSSTSENSDPGLELPLVVAVLPFRDLSGDDPGFAQQLLDKLISELAAVPRVRVLSREVIHQGQQAGWGPSDYRSQLNADFLFEGSYQSAEDSRIVRTRFVFLPKGTTAWQREFEIPVGEPFQGSEEISHALRQFVQKKTEIIQDRQQHASAKSARNR